MLLAQLSLSPLLVILPLILLLPVCFHQYRYSPLALTISIIYIFKIQIEYVL